MKQGNGWKRRIQNRLEQTGESLPMQPILELCADRRIWIENHRGVRKYTPEEIWVAVGYGHLRILGSCMKLCRMEGRILVISGRIESIHVQKEVL